MAARVTKMASSPPSDWRQSLAFFLSLKRPQGFAERTLKDYRYHVYLFFTVPEADLHGPQGLRLAVLRCFADSADLSPASFNNRRKPLTCSCFVYIPVANYSSGQSQPIFSREANRYPEVPSFLTEYIAMSACLINSAGVSPSNGYTLIPMLG